MRNILPTICCAMIVLTGNLWAQSPTTSASAATKQAVKQATSAVHQAAPQATPTAQPAAQTVVQATQYANEYPIVSESPAYPQTYSSGLETQEYSYQQQPVQQQQYRQTNYYRSNGWTNRPSFRNEYAGSGVPILNRPNRPGHPVGNAMRFIARPFAN